MNNTLQQRIYQLTNSHHLIVLSMQKAINKAIAIKETALTYQNNPSLSYRSVAKIHRISTQSVIRYYNSETTPAPDIFITSQKLSPVEEAVLIKHSVKY